MELFFGNHRHEIDSGFAKKFEVNFGSEGLPELIKHLDHHPLDGDPAMRQVPDLRVLRWERGSVQRDVFYIFRQRLSLIVYIDCVEPPDSDRGWFENIDPMKLTAIGLRLVELIEKMLGLLCHGRERSVGRCRQGGISESHQKADECG